MRVNFKTWPIQLHQKLPNRRLENGKFVSWKPFCSVGEQKRKEELVELVEKARNLSLEPLDDVEESGQVIANKLQSKEGILLCPNTLQSDWTSDFLNFTYGDMYT